MSLTLLLLVVNAATYFVVFRGLSEPRSELPVAARVALDAATHLSHHPPDEVAKTKLSWHTGREPHHHRRLAQGQAYTGTDARRHGQCTDLFLAAPPPRLV